MRLFTVFVSSALVLAISNALPVDREDMLLARFADSDFPSEVEARAIEDKPELYDHGDAYSKNSYKLPSLHRRSFYDRQPRYELTRREVDDLRRLTILGPRFLSKRNTPSISPTPPLRISKKSQQQPFVAPGPPPLLSGHGPPASFVPPPPPPPLSSIPRPFVAPGPPPPLSSIPRPFVAPGPPPPLSSIRRPPPVIPAIPPLRLTKLKSQQQLHSPDVVPPPPAISKSKFNSRPLPPLPVGENRPIKTDVILPPPPSRQIPRPPPDVLPVGKNRPIKTPLPPMDQPLPKLPPEVLRWEKSPEKDNLPYPKLPAS